jgi:hypothetical protein
MFESAKILRSEFLAIKEVFLAPELGLKKDEG